MLMNWSKEIKLLEFHGWNHFRDGRNPDSTGGLQRSLFFTSSGLVARHVLLLVGGLKFETVFSLIISHLGKLMKIITFDKHISQMGWNHQVDWIIWVFLSKAGGGPFDAFAQRRASTTSINACKDNYRYLGYKSIHVQIRILISMKLWCMFGQTHRTPMEKNDAYIYIYRHKIDTLNFLWLDPSSAPLQANMERKVQDDLSGQILPWKSVVPIYI